ncbi:MAG: PepSY-like domain-containing protein [Bacteroidetes bacterium]|nr:PepSY-like domain-containing protein [Bacteroidota bacterium]
MKKINLFKSLLTAFALTTSVSMFAQDGVIPFKEVPVTIQNYVSTHFPSTKVNQAEIDYEGLTKEYEIHLDGNIKLEFDTKNKIKEIKSTSKLPESVIPSKISEYVTANYPENYIVEWELDKTHQSVKLDNKIELEFTLKGKFLRIDN